MDAKSNGERPVSLSSKEQTAVVESIRALPITLRNPKVAKLLARSVRDPELARKLRSDPKDLFADCGVDIPSDVTIEIHCLTPKSIHLVLPSADLTGNGKSDGLLEIADEDLVTSIEGYSFMDTDNWISDDRDPTTAADTGDDPGGWSDTARDDGRLRDGGRDPRGNTD